MVESIMIFALGFLAAALIALIVIPAINARAERLARRRAEALFPLSVAELTAEKDHLRAEFAVLQRRIERKAEEAQAIKHQTMEELGRRAMRIDRLETEVAERDAAIAELQAELADTRNRLAAAEEDLAETRATFAATRETLAAVENAHRRTLDELAATRGELDRTATLLTNTKAELSLTQDRLEAREAAFADLDTRLTAALNDLDAKRIANSDLETRLALQTARGDDFERALGERKSELGDERTRLAELAKNLLAEQERGLMLETRIRELETELESRQSTIASPTDQIETLTSEGASPRADEGTPPPAEARMPAAAPLSATGGATEAELLTLSERAEDLQAAKTALEGALATAREEQARLERELVRLRRTHGDPEDIRAENAELRRLISEVADSVLSTVGPEASAPPADPAEASPSDARRQAAG